MLKTCFLQGFQSYNDVTTGALLIFDNDPWVWKDHFSLHAMDKRKKYQKNQKGIKKITYFGPKLCINSTFALDWAISEPEICFLPSRGVCLDYKQI